MILMIDNYDSFTYNLVQFLGELGYQIEVRRNDRITLDEIEAMRPDQIVISPGPGTPDDAGISVDLIRRFYRQIPILGVCLGHQAIGQAFYGKIVRSKDLMHGKVSAIEHNGQSIFHAYTRCTEIDNQPLVLLAYKSQCEQDIIESRVFFVLPYAKHHFPVFSGSRYEAGVAFVFRHIFPGNVI